MNQGKVITISKRSDGIVASKREDLSMQFPWDHTHPGVNMSHMLGK